MSLTLHYFPTPNGQKVAIALEEMGLGYDLVMVDILNGGQHAPGFRAINPNGRIPALVDDGAGVTLFESGAILQYLGRLSGRFTPEAAPARALADSWLFWQMAGLGPMLGQVNWFRRAAAKPGRDAAETSLALHRFTRECARLFDVLEAGLAAREYLAGDYSIADMACFPWVDKYHAHAGPIAARPHITRWRSAIAARPAVMRGMALGMDLVQNPVSQQEPQP